MFLNESLGHYHYSGIDSSQKIPQLIFLFDQSIKRGGDVAFFVVWFTLIITMIVLLCMFAFSDSLRNNHSFLFVFFVLRMYFIEPTTGTSIIHAKTKVKWCFHTVLKRRSMEAPSLI